jgi:hypothetical protein
MRVKLLTEVDDDEDEEELIEKLDASVSALCATEQILLNV